jgi:RNA polymerase sigma-70 factor (ECF subfamily)
VSSEEESWARARRVLARAVRDHCPSDLAAMREDLVEVAVLKVVELQGHEKTTTPPASYLRKVAFTVIIDELRRKKRGEAVRKEIALAPEPRTGGPDVQLQIRDCLGRLSAARRAAVTLYLEGLKASEIALALGWTQKRVQNMVYRGLEELRECLGPRTTDG